MTSWEDHEQGSAAEAADDIVNRALRFALDEDNGIPEYCVATAIAQHVKVQLAYLTQPGVTETFVPERTVKALEALAKAHAEDGVRVKVTQPWHRDARERERD